MPTPSAFRPDKALLTAWLLLLLNDGESYGWALFGRLRQRGISVEKSAAYRALRALERDGAVKSRWIRSDAGPQRRSYRLTAKGRRMLAQHAARIEVSWRQHQMLVRARKRVHAGHQAGGGPSQRRKSTAA